MLQAMNTGHDGSLTTVHSNSPRDTLARLETLVLMAGFDLPVRAIREQMASALDLIVQLTRLRDGTRRITHITEVQGMEGDVITLQDIFLFDFGMGVDEHGRFKGHLKATGVRPKFAEKLADLGIRLGPEVFQPEAFAGGRQAMRSRRCGPRRRSSRGLLAACRPGRSCAVAFVGRRRRPPTAVPRRPRRRRHRPGDVERRRSSTPGDAGDLAGAVARPTTAASDAHRRRRAPGHDRREPRPSCSSSTPPRRWTTATRGIGQGRGRTRSSTAGRATTQIGIVTFADRRRARPGLHHRPRPILDSDRASCSADGEQRPRGTASRVGRRARWPATHPTLSPTSSWSTGSGDRAVGQHARPSRRAPCATPGAGLRRRRRAAGASTPAALDDARRADRRAARDRPATPKRLGELVDDVAATVDASSTSSPTASDRRRRRRGRRPRSSTVGDQTTAATVVRGSASSEPADLVAEPSLPRPRRPAPAATLAKFVGVGAGPAGCSRSGAFA